MVSPTPPSEVVHVEDITRCSVTRPADAARISATAAPVAGEALKAVTRTTDCTGAVNGVHTVPGQPESSSSIVVPMVTETVPPSALLVRTSGPVPGVVGTVVVAAGTEICGRVVSVAPGPATVVGTEAGTEAGTVGSGWSVVGGTGVVVGDVGTGPGADVGEGDRRAAPGEAAGRCGPALPRGGPGVATCATGGVVGAVPGGGVAGGRGGSVEVGAGAICSASGCPGGWLAAPVWGSDQTSAAADAATTAPTA